MHFCPGPAVAVSGNGDAEFEQNNIRYAITDVNFALNSWGVRLGFRDAPRSGRLPANTQQLICGLSQVAEVGNGLEPMTFCIQDSRSALNFERVAGEDELWTTCKLLQVDMNDGP
jgi:hypothetical protein